MLEEKSQVAMSVRRVSGAGTPSRLSPCLSDVAGVAAAGEGLARGATPHLLAELQEKAEKWARGPRTSVPHWGEGGWSGLSQKGKVPQSSKTICLGKELPSHHPPPTSLLTWMLTGPEDS